MSDERLAEIAQRAMDGEIALAWAESKGFARDREQVDIDRVALIEALKAERAERGREMYIARELFFEYPIKRVRIEIIEDESIKRGEV